jgi:hypothetical protein
MTDTKNTESTRVESLIPQQLINDSAALVDFLKEYYNFLNKSGQSTNVLNTIVQNKDLDLAVEKYISIVEKEIGYGMVSDIEANKINLYKNIEQFYDAKGSLDSFKLLFRLLYNVNIEISLPKEQILIASAGTWSQETSLFSKTLSGDVFSLVNSIVYITNQNGSRILIEVERVRFVKDSIYEIIINQNYTGTIEENATITTDFYSGRLVNSIGDFSIIQNGKNFRVGQVLEVNDGINDESKSLIKTTKVDSNGGIVSFEFIRFGIDYQSDFSTFLIPVNYDLDFESSPGDYGFTADKLGRVFEGLNSHDYFSLEMNPYSLNYFGQDYLEGSSHSGNYDAVYNQSTEIQEVSQEVITDEQLDEINSSRAIINFKLTPVSRYSGAFTTNKGFLSDDIYLQDNNYYQVFSYVIKSDKRLKDYKNIVKQTVHPAGMALFGQFEITNNLDVSTAIELLVRFYSERLLDSVDTLEFIGKLIIKPVDDEILTSEFWYYDYTKPLEENISAISEVDKLLQKYEISNVSSTDVIEDLLLNKNISDTVVTSEEFERVLNRQLFTSIGALDSGIVEQANVYATGYFGQSYSEGLEETGVDKEFFKVISDTVIIEDDNTKIDYTGGEIISEVSHISELNFGQFNKNIENSVTTSEDINSISVNKSPEDIINITEAGTLDMNDYSLHYFSETYVEKIYNF